MLYIYNQYKRAFRYVELTNQLFFWNLYFKSVDKHTEGKLLIHDAKHHKDNRLQGLELSCMIS